MISQIFFLPTFPFRNIGSRNYLLDSDETNYRMFYLLNKEFSFTVDVSELGCGLNGALYFVEMMADGGLSEYPTNEAGARLVVLMMHGQACPYVELFFGKNKKLFKLFGQMLHPLGSILRNGEHDLKVTLKN